jgi:hypothetical protein
LFPKALELAANGMTKLAKTTGDVVGYFFPARYEKIISKKQNKRVLISF